MRLASLGSGSRGNATLIEGAGTRLLLDCGFPLRELERRLALVGAAADTLDAILVTHEHTDHIKGVAVLARRHRIPVWMTAGTRRAFAADDLPEPHPVNCHGGTFRIGNLEVTPFPVPHDAREPAQYAFADGRHRLGILTDLGNFTPHIVEILQACDGLFLECNHDTQMLARGPYPPSLQRRVGGNYGHLSNRRAAALLCKLDHPRLQWVVAGHLSQKNNTPELARQTLLEALPEIESRLHLAEQDGVTGWYDL